MLEELVVMLPDEVPDEVDLGLEQSETGCREPPMGPELDLMTKLFVVTVAVIVNGCRLGPGAHQCVW